MHLFNTILAVQYSTVQVTQELVQVSATISTGSVIAWVSEIIYLCVYFSRFRPFKCSIDHAKRLFYKAANSVFGKIGRIASEEEVTLQLVKSKCIPIVTL